MKRPGIDSGRRARTRGARTIFGAAEESGASGFRRRRTTIRSAKVRARASCRRFRERRVYERVIRTAERPGAFSPAGRLGGIRPHKNTAALPSPSGRCPASLFTVRRARTQRANEGAGRVR